MPWPAEEPADPRLRVLDEVVGPMLREYVVSRAMHALGIATTRSPAVVATGRTVHRQTPLPGAVLARRAAAPDADLRRHLMPTFRGI